MTTLLEALDAIAESTEEYETQHQDAGDNYAHMPREGGWQYHNSDDRLREFIGSNQIETHGLDIDTIAELVLDNFEMIPGHIFDYTRSEVFSIDGYVVGEIETEVPYSELPDGTTFADVDATGHCVHENGADSFLMYINTDAVWRAEITAADLQELIGDYAD